MSPSPIVKVDVATRIVTLLLLLVATIGTQIFVTPTFAAIYARDGVALPLSARLASETLSFLGNPIVTLVLVAGVAYTLWKRWGDAQQRLAGVAVVSLVFALVLIGQASLLLDLALKGLTLGPVG